MLKSRALTKEEVHALVEKGFPRSSDFVWEALSQQFNSQTLGRNLGLIVQMYVGESNLDKVQVRNRLMAILGLTTGFRVREWSSLKVLDIWDFPHQCIKEHLVSWSKPPKNSSLWKERRTVATKTPTAVAIQAVDYARNNARGARTRSSVLTEVEFQTGKIVATHHALKQALMHHLLSNLPELFAICTPTDQILGGSWSLPLHNPHLRAPIVGQRSWRWLKDERLFTVTPRHINRILKTAFARCGITSNAQGAAQSSAALCKTFRRAVCEALNGDERLTKAAMGLGASNMVAQPMSEDDSVKIEQAVLSMPL